LLQRILSYDLVLRLLRCRSFSLVHTRVRSRYPRAEEKNRQQSVARSKSL